MGLPGPVAGEALLGTLPPDVGVLFTLPGVPFLLRFTGDGVKLVPNDFFTAGDWIKLAGFARFDGGNGLGTWFTRFNGLTVLGVEFAAGFLGGFTDDGKMSRLTSSTSSTTSQVTSRNWLMSMAYTASFDGFLNSPHALFKKFSEKDKFLLT